MNRNLPALVLAVGFSCVSSAFAQVTVNMPWVRATVPGQNVAGAYMEIKSAVAVTLVAASSPAAKKTEIHEMKMENNVMKMAPIARLEIPSGKTVELKPGGYHVMMIDILRPLKKGETVPINLTFAGRGKKTWTVEVKAEVREGPATAGMHGYMH